MTEQTTTETDLDDLVPPGCGLFIGDNPSSTCPGPLCQACLRHHPV